MATGAAPFDALQVADLGEVAINTYNLQKSVEIIEQHYRPIIDTGCIPLTLGGDHTIVMPILRAIARRHGPVALVHVEASATAEASVLCRQGQDKPLEIRYSDPPTYFHPLIWTHHYGHEDLSPGPAERPQPPQD
jgi:hypothetical protein